MPRALAAGTVFSLLVVGVWSWTAAATMPPRPPLHLSVHHLWASYWALAAAPTGNGGALYAVLAVIYMAALLAAGRRERRRLIRQARHAQQRAEQGTQDQLTVPGYAAGSTGEDR